MKLRAVVDSDIPVHFEQQREPEAQAMAQTGVRTREDFFAHWAKILKDPACSVLTIEHEGKVAGHVCCFWRGEDREVGYWLGKEFWGQGLATRALKDYLPAIKERPLIARVAKTNPASRRVLEKCGFTLWKEDVFKNRAGVDVAETVLRLA